MQEGNTTEMLSSGFSLGGLVCNLIDDSLRIIFEINGAWLACSGLGKFAQFEEVFIDSPDKLRWVVVCVEKADIAVDKGLGDWKHFQFSNN
jgi:hypothetical protein